MKWAELSYELGRVVLVRDFIGPSGLVRVVFGPSCPAPNTTTHALSVEIYRQLHDSTRASKRNKKEKWEWKKKFSKLEMVN